MRELLLTSGGAIANLAEEQRNTQRRLARVEEIRSASDSSMRTGREATDNESGHNERSGVTHDTQFCALADEGETEDRSLRTGMLPVEDWVQESVNLRDVPELGASVEDPRSSPMVYSNEGVVSGTFDHVPSLGFVDGISA